MRTQASSLDKPEHEMARALHHAIFIMMVVFALALPLAFFPYNTSYIYTKTSFAVIMISALVLLGALRRIWTGHLYLPYTMIPVLALILVATISLGTTLPTSFSQWVLIIYFAGFYMVLVNEIRSGREAQALVMTLAVAAALISLYAILQYYGIVERPPNIQGSNAMIATLGNKSYVASFLSALFVPTLALLWQAQRIFLRCLWGGALFLMGLALLLSRAETAWLALGAAVGVFVGVGIGRPRWALALFLGGIVAATVGLGDAEVLQSLRLRLWNWATAGMIFLEHPVWGAGLGAYALRFFEYKSKLLATDFGRSYTFYIPASEHAHNEYIQLSAELGVLGLLALGGILWTVFRGWRKALVHESQRVFLGSLYGGLIALGVDGFFGFPWHRPESAAVLVFFAGILHAPNTWGKLWAMSRRSALISTVVIAGLALGVSARAYRDFRADLALVRGRVYLEAENFAEAEHWLERSRRWAIQPAPALFELGRLYLRRGDYPQAVQALELSLAGGPRESTYFYLAHAYGGLSREEPTWDYIQKFLALEPHPTQKIFAYYLRAELWYHRGDHQQALAQLRHIMRQAPDFGRAYLLAAQVYRELGERATAREVALRGLTHVEKTLEQQQHALEEALWQEGGVAMGEFTQHLREIRELEELYQDLELLLKELTPPLGSQAHGESRAKRIEP
jgi:O-antigen ligase